MLLNDFIITVLIVTASKAIRPKSLHANFKCKSADNNIPILHIIYCDVEIGLYVCLASTYS